MRLIYYRTSEGNFGDDLNKWIWDDLLPGWRDAAPDVHLMGVGTILSREMTPPGRKLVLGSGAGYGQIPDVHDGSWDIRAVRGPLTCNKLGIARDLAVADPAVMLPLLPRFASIAPTGETLFIPHHKSVPLCDWASLCRKLGIAFQSPCDDAEVVIRRIAGAGRVIAESMHAAIIADAFGVPWQAVGISRTFNAEKWQDWALGIGFDNLKIRLFFNLLRKIQALRSRRTVPTAPPQTAAPAVLYERVVTETIEPKPYLYPLGFLELARARAGRHFTLSDRTGLARAQERFRAILTRCAADYRLQ